VINRLIGDNNPPTLGSQGGPNTDWTVYTPTWTSDGTQPALGNGLLLGWYRRKGDSIEVSIELEAGTTTTYGTSFYHFSLPLNTTADATKTSGNGAFLGSGQIYANASTGNTISAFLNTPASNNIYMVGSSGGLVTPTAPFTLASTNRIKLFLSYPIAELSGLWS
jgi:hypothetical protein